MSSVRYCRKKNMTQYGSYVIFFMKDCLKIILVFTTDVKRVRMAVEISKVKLTLSMATNMCMDVSPKYLIDIYSSNTFICNPLTPIVEVNDKIQVIKTRFFSFSSCEKPIKLSVKVILKYLDCTGLSFA